MRRSVRPFSLALSEVLEMGTIADQACRERTIRATASTATRLTSWSRTTGTQGQGTRNAEEIESVQCCLVAYPFQMCEIDTIKSGFHLCERSRCTHSHEMQTSADLTGRYRIIYKVLLMFPNWPQRKGQATVPAFDEGHHGSAQ